MRIFDLLVKDISQSIRDWRAAVFMLIMPIVFTLFFGFVFGGVGDEVDPRLPVGVLDQDGGSVLSVYLLDLLEASDSVRPVVLEDVSIDDVKEQVDDEELAAAVIVPAGYSEQTLAGEDVQVTLIVESGSTAGTAAQSGASTAVARLQGAVQAAQLSADALEAQTGSADEAFVLDALDRAVQAWQTPSLAVASTLGVAVEEEDEDAPWGDNAYTHSSPGMIVQFAISGLMGTAMIMVLERKARCLQRLLTTAISRTQIILGHYLAMFVMTFVQIALLVAFGELFLDLDYLAQPLATLLVMIGTSAWTAALGLVIGVLAQTEEQLTMYAMVPMFVLSGMGGAWMPLEITGKTFQTIGHLLPTAWAMDGFKDILIRGLGVGAVLPSVAIMMGYAVVLFAIGAWRFKFE